MLDFRQSGSVQGLGKALQEPLSFSPAEAEAGGQPGRPSCDLGHSVEEQGLEGTVSAY